MDFTTAAPERGCQAHLIAHAVSIAIKVGWQNVGPTTEKIHEIFSCQERILEILVVSVSGSRIRNVYLSQSENGFQKC